MKHHIISIASLCLFAFTGNAQTEDPPPQLTGKVPLGKLAFVQVREKGRQSTIYVLNKAGSLSKIGEGRYLSLSVTSDGKKFLYGTYREPKMLAFETQITTSMPDGIMGQLSPDGSKLVSATFNPDTQNSAIETQNIDGADKKVLLSGGFGLRDASWSPDGRKIIFTSNMKGPDGANNVWMMNADGTNQVNLSNNKDWCDSPSWSPDGTRIVWTSRTTGDGPFTITVAKADGTDQKKIEGRKLEMNPPLKFDITSSDTAPAWSPDGKWIAFASLTRPPAPGPVSTGIWIMKADGTGRIELLHNAEGFIYSNVSWSR